MSAPSTPAPPRFQSASRALRAAGSLALLAALSTFLIQHWQSGSDLWRAATLLLHTIALAAAGLFCGLRARDDKAARTFLGLAGASLPIVCGVGGALLYSQLAWDAGPTALPEYATWVAPSRPAALAAAALALASALPVAGLALGVFARRRMGVLAAACVAGNAMLLVPTRDPNAIALLAAAQIAVLAALEARVLRRDPALATLEGVLARALVLAPTGLLLSRSVLHYGLSPLFHTLLWGCVAALSIGVSSVRTLHEDWRVLARWLALGPAAAGALAFSRALLDAGLPSGLGAPVAAAGFAAQLTAASLLAGRERWGGAFRRIAGLGLALACVGNLALETGVVASLLAGAASIALLGWGALYGRRGWQIAGAAGAVSAVVVHVQHAIALYEWSRWGSLALLGAVVIAAGSWVERFGPRALARLERWRRRLVEPA